jgi:predicted glutamine amidotransferase
VCRLFAMSAGRRRVQATFWLLDAPDSLAQQSRAEPDGAGLGVFTTDETPSVYRTVLAAYEDAQFAAEAREVESKTFVAHIRYASTGAVALENTHPFEQDLRLFAHNGVVGDLPKLEDALGRYRSPVHGETDSERLFALITREADRANGDLSTAIANAARWVARELPLYALNLVLTTADGIWALRYPDTHDLFVLERPAGGNHGHHHFDGASAAGRIRVHSAHLAEAPAVIVASEPMDEHPGWRNLAPGELIHVDADLNVHSSRVVTEPPAQLLRLQDLDPRAAASQQPPQTGAR